jgi:hypothetical protein
MSIRNQRGRGAGLPRTPRWSIVNRPRAAESYRKLVARHSGMNRLGNADEAANAIVWLCFGRSEVT